MPPKKRKAFSAEDQHASEIYKQKLRSYKQETSISTASGEQQQPLPSKVAKKKLRLELDEDENQKYTFKSPRPQRFAFPQNIIFYMARNPVNKKCHENLMKTCKLLFRMSRIVFVDEVYTVDNILPDIKFSCCNWYYDDAVTKSDILENPLFCKLWIQRYLQVCLKSMPHLASSLTQHIFKCSPSALTICYQILTFGELQLLAGKGSVVKLTLAYCTVKNGDGSITEFEKVFEALMCTDMIITFPNDQHGIGENTAAKMVEVLESQEKCLCIDMINIPQTFDIQAFYIFLKSNMVSRKHIIDLCFADSISSGYKDQLQKIVNEIIRMCDFFRNLAPVIEFNGHNIEADRKLRTMREDYYAIKKKRVVTIYI